MNKPPLGANPDFARFIELAVEVEKDSWVGEIGQESTTVTVIIQEDHLHGAEWSGVA